MWVHIAKTYNLSHSFLSKEFGKYRMQNIFEIYSPQKGRHVCMHDPNPRNWTATVRYCFTSPGFGIPSRYRPYLWFNAAPLFFIPFEGIFEFSGTFRATPPNLMHQSNQLWKHFRILKNVFTCPSIRAAEIKCDIARHLCCWLWGCGERSWVMCQLVTITLINWKLRSAFATDNLYHVFILPQ